MNEHVLLLGTIGFLSGMVSVSIVLFLILNDRISFLLSEIKNIEDDNWGMFIKIMKIIEKNRVQEGKTKKDFSKYPISEIENEIIKNKKIWKFTKIL